MGEMIAIPVEEYRDLRRAAEELADLRTFDQAKAAMARGEDEQVPADIARRLIAGETPLRVWRDFRGLTQQRLSVASGVNRVQIANIESGTARGSVATLVKLADALGIAVDDLV
ncbi:helix-turn-helix domain-containing protein [Novosphingobium colocasiae]|uniref:helix-turn-helix domain-containing protein n=1 Tax=Novosphingobium colocasiae TaxID=1256513 RepID=UPI0035B1E75A